MIRHKTIQPVIFQFIIVMAIFSCRFTPQTRTFADCIKSELHGRNHAIIDIADILGFRWDTLYVTSGVGLSCDSIRKLIPLQIKDCSEGSSGNYFSNGNAIVLEEIYEPFWDEPNEDMVIISTNDQYLFKVIPSNAKFDVVVHEYEDHVFYSLELVQTNSVH